MPGLNIPDEYLYNDNSGDMPAMADLVSGSTGLNVAGAMPPAARTAQATAVPKERNWLADIGMVLSSTAAGARGDFDFVRRQRESAQQKEQQDKAMALEQFKTLKDVFPIIESLKDNLPEAGRGSVAKTFAAGLKKAGLGDILDEPTLNDMFSGGTSFDE